MEQPKPTNERYSKIIEKIENGDYQIPKFQRDFVWKPQKTAELIDGLLKGFPIGSFIVWKTKERLNSVKRLGGKIFKQIQNDVDIYYILDGQQRMTSLFLALKGETANKFDYKNIYIDLDKDIDGDEPICSSNELDKKDSSISFYELMTQNPFALIESRGLEMAEKCHKLKNKIENYDFSVIEIGNLKLDKIVDIFTRINTSGRELTLFEIMNAKIYTEKKNGQNGFDLEEKYNEVLNDLNDANYDFEGKQLILQLISLNLQQNATKEAILSIAKERFINEWDESIKSFKLAIEYTRNFLKIPVSKLLPYPALLLPIAYFFKINQFNPPDELQSKLLEKYFFRSALSWRFSSATETKLNADVKLMEKIKDNQPIDFEKEIFITNTDEYFINCLKNWDFSAGSAFHKAILCIMAYAEPRSFNNNFKVRLDNAHLTMSTSKNYHHFFPKAYLKKKEPNAKANVLANITLVDDFLNKRVIRDQAPSKYIQKFEKENSKLKETLQTHFIDLDSFGIREDDYETFLQKRAKKIADEILKRI